MTSYNRIYVARQQLVSGKDVVRPKFTWHYNNLCHVKGTSRILYHWQWFIYAVPWDVVERTFGVIIFLSFFWPRRKLSVCSILVFSAYRTQTVIRLVLPSLVPNQRFSRRILMYIVPGTKSTFVAVNRTSYCTEASVNKLGWLCLSVVRARTRMALTPPPPPGTKPKNLGIT